MKSATDPRHVRRAQLMQQIFASLFAPTPGNSTLTKLQEFMPQIDALIEKAAPQFPIEKIAKIDAAILRLAVYELVFELRQPPKVVIDEAVELAKEYGGDASPSFINGVLGTVLKHHAR